MEILVVYQYFLEKDEPGLSRFNKMVEIWAENGHKVTVLAGDVHYSTGLKYKKNKKKLYTKEKYGENITVYRTFVSESYNKSFLGRLWGYFSFTLSASLVLLTKIKRHEVIISSSPPLFIGIVGVVGKFFKRMPLIFETRDIWPQSAIDLGILKNKLLIKLSYKFENWIYNYCDRNIVLTPAFKDYLVNDKNINEDKIGIVTNGADLEVFYPLKSDFVLRKKEEKYGNKFVIMYFGSHSTANKLDLLLNVAETFNQNEDVLFVFIGSGKEKENLKRISIQKKLKNVLFEDSLPREKLNILANLADLCVTILPNIDVFKTVYPSKVFDYLALGKPILIGFDGISRKLIETNKVGIYANVENVEEFKNAILYMKSNPEVMMRMSINSRKLAEGEFDRIKIANEYLEQIENEIKGKYN